MASPLSAAPHRDAGDLGPSSSIENQLSTYRAISPMAVASACFGVLSALCFTALAWHLASVLAVVSGLLALRKIGRMPEALTGRNFAQAGIAMGLVFSATSLAYTAWHERLLLKDARTFALQFNKTLNAAQRTKPVQTSDILWYMIPSAARRGLTPEDAKAALASMSENSEKVRGLDDSIRKLIEHANGEPIEFLEVESAESMNLDAYASILLKVGADDPRAPDQGKSGAPVARHADEPDGLGYALVVLKATGPRSQPNRWNVEAIRYPYVPRTYKHVPKKAESDHGHGH